MTTNTHQQSAKIYIFPTGFRARANDAVEQRRPSMAPAQRLVAEAAGGSWYHEAAIREERERAR